MKKTKMIASGLDYITTNHDNTMMCRKKALISLIRVFKTDIELFEQSRGQSYEYFYNKNLGICLKISLSKIIIEYHSTFFAIASYSVFKTLKRKIEQEFNTFLRITQIHIASDFTNLPVQRFFPKRMSRLKFTFQCKMSEKKSMKDQELETIYLTNSKGRWKICIYNKTRELKNNLTKVSPEKNKFYKEKGYFDKEVTRVELRLNSEHCLKYIETIETEEEEIELCKKILNNFYKTHKIRVLKDGEKYDKRYPNKYKVWKRWIDIFENKGAELTPSQLTSDSKFRDLHETEPEEIAKKLFQNSLRYNVSIKGLLYEISSRDSEIIAMAEEYQRKHRNTMEYLMKLKIKAGQK